MSLNNVEITFIGTSLDFLSFENRFPSHLSKNVYSHSKANEFYPRKTITIARIIRWGFIESRILKEGLMVENFRAQNSAGLRNLIFQKA